MTRDRAKRPVEKARDIVELASADSFPCSDPPPWTLGPAGESEPPAPGEERPKEPGDRQ